MQGGGPLSARPSPEGPPMPAAAATAPPLDRLTDLTRLVPAAEGFADLAAALAAGRAGTVDGAWGSSAALTAAALAERAPATVLVVIAHPGDLDAWAADLHSFSG